MTKEFKAKSSHTTGEIAEILGININTVIKWFDKGRLKGFRLPGSNERRVPLDALKDFMRTYGLPLEMLPATYEKERVYKRSHPRKVTSIEAELQLIGPKETITIPVSVLNVSKYGIRVELPEIKPFKIPAPPVETVLKVESEPLDGFKARAHLIHINATQKISLGLKFIEFLDNSEKKLAVFLESLY